ncbi:MAG: sulfatase-like hydrolase/transferase [Candidatus Latescibacterota bacterium]|nr:sulfatase-like hydrolase/transferase [Candidatus Latescibacterota bacterium]
MPSSDRPNLVVLMSDQQRLDTVSAYGLNDIVRTPHIEALAARGVRFDGAFTPTAICSPARASFLTGLYPHKHGVTANGLCVNEGVPTIPELLAPAGYRCGYAGKWHADEERGPTDYGFVGKDFLGYAFPGSNVLPNLTFGAAPRGENHYEVYLREQGFDPLPTVRERFVGVNPGTQQQEMFALHDGPVESCIEYFVAHEAEQVIDKLIDGDGDDPFFLWANFWGPHTPCLVPEPYFSMYDPASIPEHPSYCETFENKPYRQVLVEKLWGLGNYGWEGFQQIAARYFGHCTLIDDMVGKVVAKLEERGVLDNTIVVYTTDHGDCLGAHKLIEKGEFMYDEIYRIPLVIADPRCKAPGSTNDDLVYLQEVTASLLDAAGVGVPDHFDGDSFLPAIRGQHLKWDRDDVYCVFERHFTVAQQRMVRTRTHQFTFNSADQGELYDLQADPYQLHNRYGDPDLEDVRLDLMQRMRGHMERLDDPLNGRYRIISQVY